MTAPEREGLFLTAIGSYVRTRLDSTNDGRKILFEIHEMIFAKQNRRSAALPGQDHQDLAEIDQDFPRRWSGSFQYDKISHFSPQ